MIRRYCDICGAEMTDATTPAPDPTKSVASRLGHQDAMNAQRFKAPECPCPQADQHRGAR